MLPWIHFGSNTGNLTESEIPRGDVDNPPPCLVISTDNLKTAVGTRAHIHTHTHTHTHTITSHHIRGSSPFRSSLNGAVCVWGEAACHGTNPTALC